MASTATFWLADAWTMTARPVVCRPHPEYPTMWQPIKRADRRYFGVQFFAERWEAEVDIVLQLANGDRPLRGRCRLVADCPMTVQHVHPLGERPGEYGPGRPG